MLEFFCSMLESSTTHQLKTLPLVSPLLVVHQDKSVESRPLVLPTEMQGPVHWETCVRRIVFGVADSPTPANHVQLVHEASQALEVYTGESAYRFCLEVICGLRSPLIGETEVFGQFKDLFDRQTRSQPTSALTRIFMELNRDAKRVRAEHLQNLGHQSYGGLVRKKLRGARTVHLLGAGRLTSEMMVWLAKTEREIHVHVRSIERANSKRDRLGPWPIHPIVGGPKNLDGALIIAAPIASAECAPWLSQHVFEDIIDLRSEAATDPIVHPNLSTTLQGIFAEIEATRGSLLEKVRAAQAQIGSRAQDARRTFQWPY